MIASIKGEIINKEEDHLVVQVGGVGFMVYVPEIISINSKIGDFANLYTYLVVREDNLSLFGFESREQCEMFQMLIRVSGIGPRTALSVISTLSIDMIYQAVISNQPSIFNQVPGIGNKTSQKIILFLQDRLKSRIDEGVIGTVHDINSDLMDALVGLGYSVIEAQTAIQSIPKDIQGDLEERIRLALRYFSA